MNQVDQAFLRWQRIHQPRRFRESLVAAGEQLVCALSAEERRAAPRGRSDRVSTNPGSPGAKQNAADPGRPS